MSYWFERRYIDPQEVLGQKNLISIFQLCFGEVSTHKLFLKYKAYFHPQLIQRFLREMNPMKNGKWVHYDVQKTLAVNYIKYASRMSGIRQGSDRMTMLKMIRDSEWPQWWQHIVHKELFDNGAWQKDPRDVVVYIDEDLYQHHLNTLPSSPEEYTPYESEEQDYIPPPEEESEPEELDSEEELEQE